MFAEVDIYVLMTAFVLFHGAWRLIVARHDATVDVSSVSCVQLLCFKSLSNTCVFS